MKSRIVCLIIAFLINSVLPAYAGYSSTAYGGTKDETMLSRVSDWFATVGKSQDEKYIIKAQRRAERKKRKAMKAIAENKKKLAK